MKITYHGHSCVQVEIEGKSLVIDPFVSGNPAAIVKPEDIRADFVLLTHAHSDHTLDAVPIALNNNAPIVANFEVATYMGWQGAQTIPMNIGGALDLGFAKITMIQAFHSSGMTDEENKVIGYGGMPGGFIIEAGGKTLLHAGDTGLFGDMKMYGELFNIDVALLPIGGQLTMGPEDAVTAARWFGAKQVVPIHFNTFPFIQQDEKSFAALLEDAGIGSAYLQYGETLSV